TQIALLNQRLGWLPPSGLKSFLTTFPNYLGVSPYFFFYKDNLSLDIKTYGTRIELGLFGGLSAGINFQRTNFISPITTAYLTSYKWSLYYRVVENVLVGAGFGNYNINYGLRRKGSINDFLVRVEKKDVYTVTLTFEETDASLAIFSNYLISQNYNAKTTKLNAQYESKNHLKVIGYYNYITLSDGNKGNDLLLRIGKRFYEKIYFGYEYYYAQYKFIPTTTIAGVTTTLYYAPQNFESHSLWAEMAVENTDELKIELGGKIGYIPLGDSMVREFYLSGTYHPIQQLQISGRVGFGSTFRYDYSYNSVNASLSVFWSF
ncbi:MAG: hypothetical protein Q8K40_01965, partial [Ignavibacteria bacterium]|nr:hypothetical protein [Ignavibacteria bacterium]